MVNKRINKTKKEISYTYINKKSLIVYNITGDFCVKCFNYKGDLKMLELHHINPLNKLFGLSRRIIKSKNLQIVIKEVEKCLPLCPNCHREYHLNYWSYSDLDVTKLKQYQIDLIKNYVSTSK